MRQVGRLRRELVEERVVDEIEKAPCVCVCVCVCRAVRTRQIHYPNNDIFRTRVEVGEAFALEAKVGLFRTRAKRRTPIFIK